MEIQHKDDGTKGVFFVKPENKILAEMTYVWSGTDRIIIDHTEVSDLLKGKGIGKQMVAKAVEFARAKGIKILPLCPLAKSVINRVDEFNDVI